jgi:hypothetical protein
MENPAAFPVHHLSVPTYMLQHNAYTREGWLSVRDLLRQFVEDGLPPSEARRRGRLQVDGGQRSWSFTRGPKLPGVEQIHWTMTVAEVRLDSPEHYCADVRRWAASVLADSAAVVKAAR